MLGKDTTLIFYGRNVGGKLHKFLAETSAIRKAKTAKVLQKVKLNASGGYRISRKIKQFPCNGNICYHTNKALMNNT